MTSPLRSDPSGHTTADICKGFATFSSAIATENVRYRQTLDDIYLPLKLKIMERLDILEREIQKIKDRNQKVETDKTWETSWLRKIAIAVLTYIVVVLFFYVSKLGNPFVNAIVPTMGFLLSTLSVSLLKDLWIKYFFTRNKK